MFYNNSAQRTRIQKTPQTKLEILPTKKKGLKIWSA